MNSAPFTPRGTRRSRVIAADPAGSTARRARPPRSALHVDPHAERRAALVALLSNPLEALEGPQPQEQPPAEDTAGARRPSVGGSTPEPQNAGRRCCGPRSEGPES